jgi:histidinol dehydrogenase
MNSLKIIDSEELNEETIPRYIPRGETQLESIKEQVNEIIQLVKEKGDIALINLTQKFDDVGVSIDSIQVSKEEISRAYKDIDPNLLQAIHNAKNNLILFNEAQKREDWNVEIIKGVIAGQVYRPIDSIGIYIPGGRAIYPSTVLMIAAPAYVAGIKEVIMCSPPQSDGNIAPEILIAANEFNIEKIYKVGGAQAIAALAYGTETIPKVQKVIGPGNKWVNTAKQLLSNVIAIDAPAGPSEILIIADEYADPNYLIIDFLSQIEHDPDNIGIIVSESDTLINNVTSSIEKFIKQSKRRSIIDQAIQNNSLIVKAKNLKDCVRISNLIAPEHLEILVENPTELIKDIRNAGAIFIGPYSPVPLGDYSAGTNHILPTGGTAKKFSGLNLYDFLKTIDILNCDKEGFKSLSETAIHLAEFEGLYGHKRSIEERLKDKD